MKNKQNDLGNLVRFATYAKMKNKTVQWVYQQERLGRIDVTKVDGVKFVAL